MQQGVERDRRHWNAGATVHRRVDNPSAGQHGLTQYELADQLAGVSGNDAVTREEVSRWERGKRIPGPYWRNWLSEVLGCPSERWETAALAARRSRRIPVQRRQNAV